MNNVSSVLEKEKEQRKDLNLEFIKRIENEKSKTEKIVSDLKAEFLSILSEREEQHRIEVEDLKTQIRSFESTLREEMKSPLKKFVEKYQNKQVK